MVSLAVLSLRYGLPGDSNLLCDADLDLQLDSPQLGFFTFLPLFLPLVSLFTFTPLPIFNLSFKWSSNITENSQNSSLFQFVIFLMFLL